MLAGLYAITDPQLSPGDQVLIHAEQALAGGSRLLQYRDKTADSATALRRATALRALCQRYGALFLVNDNAELARAAGADGVHIGQRDGQLTALRRDWPEAIIGITCHNRLDLARQAEQDGASYVAFGRLFPSLTKPDAPACTLKTLREARQRLQIPICAIGGISLANIADVRAAGADMAAVIHGLFAAEDVQARSQQLSRAFGSGAMPS